MAMTYGNVYVAKVAMGANDIQTLRAFIEAEAWDGPSLIIAYSHCIAHGIDMSKGMQQQKAIVDCGLWPLFRYNPALVDQGKNPFKLDSKAPTLSVKEFTGSETRFNMLSKSKPAEAGVFNTLAQKHVEDTWRYLSHLEKTYEPTTATPTAE